MPDQTRVAESRYLSLHITDNREMWCRKLLIVNAMYAMNARYEQFEQFSLSSTLLILDVSEAEL